MIPALCKCLNPRHVPMNTDHISSSTIICGTGTCPMRARAAAPLPLVAPLVFVPVFTFGHIKFANVPLFAYSINMNKHGTDGANNDNLNGSSQLCLYATI